MTSSSRGNGALDDEQQDDNARGAHLRLAQRHRKIVAGRFKGRRALDVEDAAPGVRGQVALCFTTSGALASESRLVCQFPDHGWGIPASPTATLKLPQGCAVPQLKSAWQPTTRLLEFTLLGEGIGGDTPVVLLVSGVSTPEAATPQAEIVVTAYEKLVVRSTVPASTRGSQVIDGPCAFVIPKLPPGQIAGAKRWLPFSCCPGAVSDVSLAFCVNGRIPLGGKILIELPADGWDMDDRPSVRLWNTHYHNAVVPATWDRAQHVFEIVVPSGATPIPMKSNVALTIANVRNPANETGGYAYAGGASASASARITTLSASVGVIDGPSKLDVARISELRESGFDIASKSFDDEDAEKSGVIAVNKLSAILTRAHVHLCDALYQSLVAANLPLRMHADHHSSDSAAPQSGLDGDQAPDTPSETSIPTDRISKAEFLNLFARVYAPVYKFGQELRLACGRGHVDSVREWISRGCDPNAKDGSGWAALHYAADFGHLDVVQVLLECATPPPEAPATSLSASSVHHPVDVDTRDACG